MKKSKKSKKWIPILIVLLIALIILLSVLLKKNKEKVKILHNISETDIEDNNTVNLVDFYTVSDCIQTYYNYITLNMEGEIKNFRDKRLELNITTDDQKRKTIYDILDKEYINKNNITLNNIYNYIPSETQGIKFDAVKMKMENKENIKSFFVYGRLDNQGEVKYIYVIVNLDNKNMTFSIYPLLGENINNINDIKYNSTVQEIIPNDNNTYVYTITSQEFLMDKYINYYKTSALYDIESAYNLFDKDYRDKKFGSIDEYRKFVENNKEKIFSSRLYSYQTKYDGDKNRYICLDQNGSYYIFKENSIMDYTVQLDNYTIDQPEFIEKYNKCNEQEKVALNIDKFFRALNDKDYRYTYGCLADSFKNNYFKTQEEFEEYAKNNLYSNSQVEYNEYKIEGNLYTYSITIKNTETKDEMNKTFIMKLGTGTEFELSFNR